MYLCCLILKWQIILLFVHWVCNLHIKSFIFLMKKIVYRNMYTIQFIHTIYISYLFVFRWSDIRRLKSVARCIVPIELVHVRLQTTTSDLVKLCFAWRQKPVKSVTSSTHFLIKKSYWWETYTNILFCKDFLDNILAKNMSRWWTATKQLPILGFLESGK